MRAWECGVVLLAAVLLCTLAVALGALLAPLGRWDLLAVAGMAVGASVAMVGLGVRLGGRR